MIKKPPPIWVYPCPNWKHFNTRTGGFLSDSYYNEVGKWTTYRGKRVWIGNVHPGQDINGNGGGDTDLGAPVVAISRGIVTHAQYHSVWGNIVVVRHPHAGTCESQYAHLDHIAVKLGDEIEAATVLGGIGKGGNNRYLAHLHFEVRKAIIPADDWPSIGRNRTDAETYTRGTRVHPIRFLESKHAQAR